MNGKPKVFVTNAYPAMMGKLKQAEKYGDIMVLTDIEFRGGPGHETNNRSAMNHIKAMMNRYIPGHDYILTAGNMINAMATARFLHEGTHNILKWNNKWEDYEIVPLEIT